MYRLLLIPRYLRVLSDFLYRHKDVIITYTIIAVFVVVIVFSVSRARELDRDVKYYEEQIAILDERITSFEELVKTNEKLTSDVENLKKAYDILEGRNRALEEDKALLEAEVEWLEGLNSELLDLYEWFEQAEKRPQPDEQFKVTFYSTQQEYRHLIPGKTVAMNSQQVADLGMKRGDEFFLISKRGWSGFYTITDSGCAYGTIDIYVAPGGVPSWGVEYGAEILI